jgi:hypothetical protein
MLPFHDLPEDTYTYARPLVRGARWVAHIVRHRRTIAVLSWLIWLLAVAIFAAWTRIHYYAPSGPDWIGMTIRTTVFATWTQILREWLMLRVPYRQRRPLKSRSGTR